MTMHFDLSQPWVGNIKKIFVSKIFQCFCRFLVLLKTRALIKRVLQQENELGGRTHKDDWLKIERIETRIINMENVVKLRIEQGEI